VQAWASFLLTEERKKGEGNLWRKKGREGVERKVRENASSKPFSLHCISRQENWADILNLVAVHTPG